MTHTLYSWLASTPSSAPRAHACSLGLTRTIRESQMHSLSTRYICHRSPRLKSDFHASRHTTLSTMCTPYLYLPHLPLLRSPRLSIVRALRRSQPWVLFTSRARLCSLRPVPLEDLYVLSAHAFSINSPSRRP